MNSEPTAQHTDEKSRFIRSPSLRNSFKHLEPWITALALTVCLGAFFYHFNVIRKYSVNLPYWDDWALVAGDNHPAAADLKWLYVQHNEHRTTTTKLFVWMQYHLNGWNNRTHQLIDFFIYGFFLALLIWFARKQAPEVPTWWVLSFVIFLLSPIIWLEHFMAYPVAVHFWMLFFLISAYFMFANSQKWPVLLVGCLASILSLYSFASGFVTSFVLIVVFGLFKFLRAREAPGKKERNRELLQLALVVGLIGGALIGWIVDFHKNPLHPPWAYPYHRLFWSVFLNLVSFSFGVDRISAKWGAICLLIVLVPMCGILWKEGFKILGTRWAALVMVLGILADFALISLGRAGFGPIVSKVQEYAEHGTPLIILSVLNWSLLLKNRKRLKFGMIAALWLLCLCSFANNWDFSVYRTEAAQREEGRRCVIAYYEQQGNGRCPTIYLPNASLAPMLKQAKRLNVSFYRELPPEVREKAKDVSYFGVLDDTSCRSISGWALNTSDPKTPSRLDIYDQDRVIATVSAASLRPDVSRAGFGNGFSGFNYPTPLTLRDGKPHLIRVRFSGTAIDLQGSPKSLICPQQ